MSRFRSAFLTMICDDFVILEVLQQQALGFGAPQLAKHTKFSKFTNTNHLESPIMNI